MPALSEARLRSGRAQSAAVRCGEVGQHPFHADHADVPAVVVDAEQRVEALPGRAGDRPLGGLGDRGVDADPHPRVQRGVHQPVGVDGGDRALLGVEHHHQVGGVVGHHGTRCRYVVRRRGALEQRAEVVLPWRGDPAAEQPGALAVDVGPRRPGPAEQVALRHRHAEADHRVELAELLDALGQHRGVDPAGEGADHLHQRALRLVAVDPGDQLAVQLDDVRADPDQVLEPGVAGARVVDGDQRARVAEPVQGRLERLVGVDPGVLGQLDHHAGEVRVLLPDREHVGVVEHVRARR